MEGVTVQKTMWKYDERAARVARVESAMLEGARNHFSREGYTEITVPHITKATGACENIDTLFPLDYFGERAYLCQTGQLYLETLIPKLGKTFTTGPSFRAEPDVDNRHLTEFTLLEIELETDFNGLLTEIEKTVRRMLLNTVDKAGEDISALGGKPEWVEECARNFQRIEYGDAVNLLEKPFGVKWGDDLKSRHEQYIVEKNNGYPTFITHFPKAIKFFNMRENAENAEIVNSADLIVNIGGECVGAAEREFTYENVRRRLLESPMLKRLESKGGGIGDFEWYLENMREHGSVPHAGCGIGLNRITQFMIGEADIRRSTPFAINRATVI